MVPDVVGSTPAIHPPIFKTFNTSLKSINYFYYKDFLTYLFILFVRWYQFLVEIITTYVTPLFRIFRQIITNKLLNNTFKINNLQYSESYWFLYVSKMNTYISKKVQKLKK